MTLPHRQLAARMAVVLAFALVAAVRFHRLDALPAEWYGDISTLYECVLAVRDGNFPRGLYSLGVGPLYPLLLSPLLTLLGVSYLTIKVSAVLWSLAGLAALYWVCRQIGTEGFALLATLVAGTGSWLLIYSRLGDVEAPVPFFAMAPLALAIHVVEGERHRQGSAVLCGLLTGGCFYLYGASFAVPILIVLVLLGSRLFVPEARVSTRLLGLFLAAFALALLPMAITFLRDPEALTGGHFASRMASGQGAVATLVSNVRKAMAAYATLGDPGFRGNPGELPHVDRLSLLLAIVGAGAWWKRGRRRWGLVLCGGFLLMHLPSVLTADVVPSAPRTIAAAPFAYILVASGIWWPASVIARRLGRTAAVVATAALLSIVAAINLHRYFVLYAAGLPYQNTPVARAVTSHVDSLPAGTAVYLVGSGWAPGFMPEPKTIRYTMKRPEAFHELAAETFDCGQLAALDRPAVLVWSYESSLPTPRLGACGATLRAQLVSTRSGLPLFHLAALGGDP